MENSTSNNKSGRKVLFIIVLISLLLLCALCFLCTTAFYSAGMDTDLPTLSSDSSLDLVYAGGDSYSKNKLLVVPIQGVILNEKPDDILALLSVDVTYGYEVKTILAEAASDDSIKGVLLAIDSPGGTITGSKAISDGVADYIEQTGNPVVAHIMGTGASGGYWSAAAADYIIADSGSLVGSIGVIFGPFKYYNEVTSESSQGEGITASSIDTYYITSGELKDFGNPYRIMTQEEMEILQEDTDSAYNEFVKYISERRGIPENTIKNQIKALPYGNERALSLKLIDANGPRESAYEYLSSQAGLGSDYQLVKVFEEVSFWDLFLGATNSVEPMDASSFIEGQLHNKLLYLYGSPSAY